MCQELRVLSILDPVFPIQVVLLDFLNIVCVPGCSWVLDFKTFAFESFHLLDFLGRRHGRFQFPISVELVGLQVIAEHKIGPVDDFNASTLVFDCIDSFVRCIGHLKSDWGLQTGELVLALGEEFDTLSDF